jgi:ABC-type Na+ efflux pump permease subunit
MRRALERNPVGWLQRYRTTARLTKWGWALGLVVVEPWLLAWLSWDGLPWALFWLGVLLVVGISISAAGSFREERENGAFELLLVTPLRERDLVWGRLRGLWVQFLPGGLMILLPATFWSLSGGAWGYRWWDAAERAFCEWLPLLLGSVFLCLPVVGLWMSMVRRTFVGAWFGTLLAGLVVPGFLALLAYAYLEIVLWNRVWVGWAWSSRLVVLFASGQLLVAVFAALVLLRRLTRRRFGLRGSG